jgi:hypothetical protein
MAVNYIWEKLASDSHCAVKHSTSETSIHGYQTDPALGAENKDSTLVFGVSAEF